MNSDFYERIAKFSQVLYDRERGTKKAVDQGIITMQELTTYHYINTLTNHFVAAEMGDSTNFKELWTEKFPKSIEDATKTFKISELEAKAIFEKVKDATH